MDRIRDVVHDSVSGALQEIKSDNEVLSNPSNQPAFSQDTLQKVVRTVGQEEDRANNLMVFGTEESDTEVLHERVQELFAKLEEKPQF